MSTEIKLLIQKIKGLGDEIYISPTVADQLMVEDGDFVRISVPEQGFATNISIKLHNLMQDFICQVDENLPDNLGFNSMELLISRIPKEEGGIAGTPQAQKPSGASSIFKALAAATISPPAPTVPPVPPASVASSPIPPVAQPAPAPAPAPEYAPAPAIQPASLQAVPQQPAVAVDEVVKITRVEFLPNQVDQYQNLIVDEYGGPVYGLDEVTGLPLDPFGKPFMEAKYEEQVIERQVPVTTIKAKKKKVQVLVPNQVDSYGYVIVDFSRNPVYGLDDSGWYALDSTGAPFANTHWEEIEIEMDDAEATEFNAILIIDISRSMMARDLMVQDVSTSLKAIRSVMEAPQIHKFLSQFKEGYAVPRRVGAALGAITFFTEKIARGYGEKVAVIRFADVAETLDFDGLAFMTGEDSSQGHLESTAIKIIEDIGESYGSATNMGQALFLAQQLIDLIAEMEGGPANAKPVSCLLLTDGFPTDGANFNAAVGKLAQYPNLSFSIVGMGSPNVEEMQKAASMCNGEFIMADDALQLLTWYIEKARKFSK